MKETLKSISFADDESSFLQLLQTICKQHYQIVGQAQNGLEAVTLVRALKPQVLILDYHMPGMNGLEALKQITPLRTTAVILMTADQNPELAREAMDSGACGYITKPFALSQVIPTLEMAWHRFQSTEVLNGQILTLSETLETRKLVERAKGILMEQQGFTEEQAHKMLQKLSQDQAISLKEVCHSLIQVKMLLGKSNMRKAV